MMSPTERFYRRLLRQLRQRYGEVVGDIIFREKSGAPAWVDFRNGLEEVFRWASIVQSGKIRYRALGEKIELPGPIDEIELGDLMDANPWLRGQSEVLFPIIAQQTDAVVDAEKTFVQEKAEAIKRNPKGLPLYRLEAVYRNTLATIVATSDQAQLADPDVGNAFPYFQYNTREDGRVRPTHRAMDGFVALRQGEGLDIMRHVLPPAGFSCRCFAMYFGWSQAVRKGWAKAKGEPKWEFKWPSKKARMNYEAGLFPEWSEPRFVAPLEI